MQAIHFHGVLLTVSGGDTIAIYHCSIKIVSRGKGKSAVAAAAYRAGEKLTNEWDGLTHDYTRKGGVVHSEIMLPPHAPPSFSDRSILWNSVEQIEKSNNSQLAREIEIALPVELSREEQTRLVREYCSSQFVSKGMCADFNIHDTGNGNPHAHILLTMRPLDEKGTWAAKSKKEYVLDENGERVKLPSGRYKTRKVDLMDWNRQENADLWRKAWADLANDYLERSGSAERIDHRSHAERGIEELPTVHMGVAASQMEKKGIATDKGEINRMIQKTNRLMREIRGYIDSLKEWLAEVFAAKKQLQAAPHSPDIATLLTRYLSIEREKSRKYSQGWQQQHTAGELQKISKAIVYLQSKGIATLEDLDAALSSVDEEAKRLNTSVVAKQKRMRTLEKFIEHGSNYNRLKPIHDELKTLKNGWGKKREKFEQAHESDLIIWNAANRFLHANLPEGTKSFNPGEGKTTLALRLCAACTNRKPFPAMAEHEPFNVIYQTAEDGLGDTVKPRLMEADADLDRVLVIDEGKQELSLSDERIERAIRQTGARLIILDPIQAYVGEKTDMNKANEIRPIFRRLAEVAERTGCAVVLIGHLNKAAGGQSAYRGLGSIDFRAAARSVLLIGRVKREPNVRVIIHDKSSLAPEGKPMAFSLGAESGFSWIGEYDITADELLSGTGGNTETKTEQAERLILDLLADGKEMASEDIVKAAAEAGISERTVQNAKRSMGGILGARRVGSQWYNFIKKKQPPETAK